MPKKQARALSWILWGIWIAIEYPLESMPDWVNGAIGIISIVAVLWGCQKLSRPLA